MSQPALELIEYEQLVVPPPRPAPTQSTAELAECTCPEWCERDHDRD